MGYRSVGWFMLPRSATREFERRHRIGLKRQEQQRIKDKEKAEADGRHFIYAETKPWDSLSGFDHLELFEKDGREYVKYNFDGWKWYEGYPFPQLVAQMLYDVAYPDVIVDDPSEAWLEDLSPVLSGSLGINQPTLIGYRLEEDIAAFVRSGEDWNDVDILDNTGYLQVETDMDGNPWFDNKDCIFVIIDRTHGTAGLSPAASKAADDAEMDLKALKPEKIGDLYSDPNYPAFHWDHIDIDLWKKIGGILEKLSEWEVESAAIRYNHNAMDYDAIGDYYNYDIYLNAGWDETEFMEQFTPKGHVSTSEIHPYLDDQKL
jgi:hypothetical protein